MQEQKAEARNWRLLVWDLTEHACFINVLTVLLLLAILLSLWWVTLNGGELQELHKQTALENAPSILLAGGSRDSNQTLMTPLINVSEIVERTRSIDRSNKALRVAWCTPTLFGNVRLLSLRAWEYYYQKLGVSKVFVYIDDATNPSLQRALKQSTLFESRVNQKAQGKYHGQQFAIKDCWQHVLESVPAFDWVGFGDLDAFIGGAMAPLP